MPRIPRGIIKELRSKNPLLPLLYRDNRTRELAEFDLRFLKEHVKERKDLKNSPSSQFKYLKSLCNRRAKGEPLAHILKTTWFYELELLSGRGALIPRPETESMVMRLCDGLKNYHFFNERRRRNLGANFRVLDLCTGSGPIALLMAKMLYDLDLPNGFRVCGVDISEPALRLAKKSLEHNIRNGTLPEKITRSIGFIQGDVLGPQEYISESGSPDHFHCLEKTKVHDAIKEFFMHNDVQADHEPTVDIIVANPPYISAEGYWEDTERSVRLYEPEIALVPPSKRPESVSDDVPREDIFYPVIEQFAAYFKSKAIVFETGGDKQSDRVKAMLEKKGWETGIWKDFRGIKRNVVGWRKESGWSWLLLPSKDGLSHD